jgi:hypothetical protein
MPMRRNRRRRHDSERAVLIYQHASKAERAIADALSRLAEDRQSTDREGEDDGAAGALVRAG